jgi:hypothetical protein
MMRRIVMVIGGLVLITLTAIFGSALLQHAFIQCDRDSKLALPILNQQAQRASPSSKRHGFEVLGTIIQAGKSPPIFPMLRRPQ